MFYSHQLLEKKAPLGQIWMAATLHAKINRRRLDKLDIIKICEQILNPAVPMALRLSGILMGGVVIVYERKVKLLYDDVNRLVVEINEAWKTKPAGDPTLLPEGKSQAKFEAVTLPARPGIESEPHQSDASLATAKRFQRMQLDDVDDLYIKINLAGDTESAKHHHQAEAANITLADDFGWGIGEAEITNQFERFDLDGDEDTQMHLNQQEQSQKAPPNNIKSPILQQTREPEPTSLGAPNEAPLQDDITMVQQLEEEEEHQAVEPAMEVKEAELEERLLSPVRRKARRNNTKLVIDNDQIMIPGNVYQSWLQDTSSIVSKNGRRKNPGADLSTKLEILMGLPPITLIDGINSFSDIQYPAPLMAQWKRSIMPNSARSPPPSGERLLRSSRNQSRNLPTEELYPDNIQQLAPEELQSHVDSLHVDSIEKRMAMDDTIEFVAHNDMLSGSHTGARNSSQSNPSSGSGPGLSIDPEILPSTRSKRKSLSSARGSLGNLDPVEEDTALEQSEFGLKLRKISEDEPGADQEQLIETGPTQTPHRPLADPSVDKVTQTIRTHFKQHFEAPGAPQFESLNELAFGMSRKKAAQLFYQTCVLATRNFVEVKQAAAYGDILISRGNNL